MDTQGEIWQVDVDGTLYEADTDTLKQWVLDGYVTPQTKVQKGSLKWIEAQRVPALRGLFATGPAFPETPPAPVAPETWSAPRPPADSDWSTTDVPSYGQTPAAAAPGFTPGYDAYGQPAAAAGYGMCVNHAEMRAKFLCQGCGASLCMGCTKRYGNAAVCTLCGELCRPFGEAQAKITRNADRYSPFGMDDFAKAMTFPTKDLIGIGMAALIFGFLLMFGIWGRLFAGALLFGYMTGAIRRVSMGQIDEGPVPDLSDPGDLVFTSAKLGLAVTLITFGPMLAVLTTSLTHLPSSEALIPWALGVGAGIMLGGLWALFYYPMALLVAGYTQDFLATINPLVGLTTMKRMGSAYVKAFVMYVVVVILQFVLVGLLGGAKGMVPLLGLGAVVEAVFYFGANVLEGAVYFFASMVIAAILGLAVYKKADELDVYIAN